MYRTRRDWEKRNNKKRLREEFEKREIARRDWDKRLRKENMDGFEVIIKNNS